MTLLQSGLAKSLAAADAYTIDNSLRFNFADSAYLSRTPGSAGNQKTWTVSFWFKKAGTASGADPYILVGGSGTTPIMIIGIDRNENLWVRHVTSSGYDISFITSQVFRDSSAWYHIVVAMDTTQAVEANRTKIYVNGSQVTAFSTATYPTLNLVTGLNDDTLHEIMKGDGYHSGYLAEFYNIDGLQYAASDFGELSSTTNQWIPKNASGLTFGTNGFYQKYGDTTLATTFTDSSASPHAITGYGDVTNSLAQKKVGSSSIKFDGSGDYLSVASASDMVFSSTDPFTLETWIRFDAVAGAVRYFFSGTGCTVSWDSNYSYFQAGLGSGWGTWTNTPSVDTWIHVAIVGDGSDVKIYFDGTERISYSQAGTVGSPTNPLLLGTYGATTYPLTGYMDEIRLSDIARYTTTFTPSTTAFTADANTILLISNWDGGLGKDSSGNANDFAPTNLVATDQMIDTPTNNFCTINPVDSTAAVTFSEGNLQAYYTTWTSRCNTTFACPTAGKWYMETCGILGTYGNYAFGGGPGSTVDPGWTRPAGYMTGGDWGLWGDSGAMVSYVDGGITHTLTGLGWAGSDAGTVIAIAYDADNNGLWYSRDGVWIDASGGSASSGTVLAEVGTSGTTYRLFTGSPIGNANMVFSCSPNRSAVTAKIGLNFGQDSSFAGTLTAASNADSNDIGEFKYPVPDGFLALCTDNLSDPEIALPEENFETVLFTGTGATRTVATSFQSDFAWFKQRGGATNHLLYNSITGGTNALASNTYAVGAQHGDAVLTFNSANIQIAGTDTSGLNGDTESMVLWNWKAGGAPTATNSAGAGATPTAGSVKIDGSNLGSALAGDTPLLKLSANTTSGFSIGTYTGDGATATIAHGLSQGPELVMVKAHGGASAWNWAVGATPMDNWTDYMVLDGNAAAVDNVAFWNDAPPSSSVITIGSNSNVNYSGSPYVFYAFHSVEGYSKVGSYVGNGNADGTFMYTGFKPAYIMIKDITAARNWAFTDSARSYANVANHTLAANLNSAESSFGGGESVFGASNMLDLLSNGFKIRETGSWANTSGDTYIFLAFAESPFKYSNAR